jgi:hypothetical protein
MREMISGGYFSRACHPREGGDPINQPLFFCHFIPIVCHSELVPESSAFFKEMEDSGSSPE